MTEHLKDAKNLDEAIHESFKALLTGATPADVREELKRWIMNDQPWLGFATTQQLVTELHARVEVSATIGEEWPKYKTVGERK